MKRYTMYTVSYILFNQVIILRNKADQMFLLGKNNKDSTSHFDILLYLANMQQMMNSIIVFWSKSSRLIM